jgi:hypothetical protein
MQTTNIHIADPLERYHMISDSTPSKRKRVREDLTSRLWLVLLHVRRYLGSETPTDIQETTSLVTCFLPDNEHYC